MRALHSTTKIILPTNELILPTHNDGGPGGWRDECTLFDKEPIQGEIEIKRKIET